MKTTLMTIMLAATVSAGAAEPGRTDINPALTYYQAFLLAPDFSQGDHDYLFTNQWLSYKLPERVNKLMVDYDNQFSLLCQAARSTVPCDWGIDMTAGPRALLPGLARCKAVSQAARLRVSWHLEHGRQKEAVNELVAAFVLARNTSRDGTLIASLVQIAMEAINCATVAENFGRFTPEALSQLQAGLAAAPARRTTADCLPTEKAFFLDWTKRKVLELQKENPGNDAKVMEGLAQLLDFENQESGREKLWERIKQASGGTSQGVLRLLEDREHTYDSAMRILTLPYADYVKQYQGYVEQFEKSPNPFVTETMPAWIKSRQREFRVLAYLGMVQAAIEYKLHGQAGLQSVPDPCGNGPFAFRRFVFEGVDRGFELRSSFDMSNNKAVLIFVENDGPPFRVTGNYPGQAVPKEGQ